jgi:small basic protein
MWAILPIVGLLIGLVIGGFISIEVPAAYVKYFSIAILAALDSVFGGIRSTMEGRFDSTKMISGFFVNALAAGLLAYLGDRLAIDLYMAAVFAFGVRLFDNIARIRHLLIDKWRNRV